MVMGFGNSLNGTTEERARYNALLEACSDIQKLHEFQEFFNQLNQFHSLRLAVTNTGRTFDEDLDITLEVPKGTVVRHSKLPVPGEFIISEFSGNSAVEYLFGLTATASIETYDSGYPSAPTLPSPSLSFPMLQRSQADVYQENLEEYQSNINSLFQYEYFSEPDFDLVRFHIGYLKQHSSMWLPTVLIFSGQLEQIEYSITSKHSPDEVKGSFTIDIGGQQ